MSEAQTAPVEPAQKVAPAASKKPTKPAKPTEAALAEREALVATARGQRDEARKQHEDLNADLIEIAYNARQAGLSIARIAAAMQISKQRTYRLLEDYEAALPAA